MMLRKWLLVAVALAMTIVAQKHASAQIIEFDIEISEGEGKDATIITGPRITTMLGQPATMEISEAGGGGVSIQLTTIENDARPEFLARVQIRRAGRTIATGSVKQKLGTTASVTLDGGDGPISIEVRAARPG